MYRDIINFKKVVLGVVMTIILIILLGYLDNKNNDHSNETKIIESLFDKTKITEAKSGDMDLYVSMDISSYIEELDMEANSSVEKVLNLSFINDTTHIIGDIKTSSFNTGREEEVDKYSVKHNDKYIIYDHEPENENWYYIISDNNFDVMSYMNMTNIDKDLYKSFELTESDTYYIVRGELMLNDIKTILNTSTENLFNDFISEENNEYGVTKLEVTFLFDKTSEEMLEYRISLNNHGLGEDNMVNNFEIRFVINNINTSVKVPLPEAIEELEKQQS